jgi:hypothetical protein
MKKRLAVAAILGVALVAFAGPIKTWSAGEVITASDLNANFQHIHNLMVGGHGARLVNSDVSASAAISHSKLATPALLPKAMGGIYVPCDGGTCTWNVTSGFTPTFTRSSIGQFTLTFSSTRANANYVPVVTPVGDAANSPSKMHCGPVPTFATTGFGIHCSLDVADGGGFVGFADMPFSVVVFDNDN